MTEPVIILPHDLLWRLLHGTRLQRREAQSEVEQKLRVTRAQELRMRVHQGFVDVLEDPR